MYGSTPPPPHANKCGEGYLSQRKPEKFRLAGIRTLGTLSKDYGRFYSRQLHFAYLAVFFTWVSCLTPKFAAHDRKLNLQKFPTMTKKDKMRISCESISKIRWRSKDLKCN